MPPAEIVPALLPSPPIGGAASGMIGPIWSLRGMKKVDVPLYVTGYALQADQAPSVAIPLDQVPAVVVALPVGVKQIPVGVVAAR